MAYHTIPWCTFTDLYHTIPYHTIPYHVQISHLMSVYLAMSTTAAYASATTQGPKQASRASTGRNYLFLRRADFSSDMADGKAPLDPLRSVQFSSVHERPSRGFLWCAFTDLYHTIPKWPCKHLLPNPPSDNNDTFLGDDSLGQGSFGIVWYGMVW